MSEKIDTDIGARIKQIRGAAHTQQEFADLLDIGTSTLINYEGNIRVPNAEFLLKLYMLYKVQPLWLLTGIGDDIAGVKLKPDESALLGNYRRCLPGGQAALMATSAALAAGIPPPGGEQVFHGEVGQVIRGSVNQSGMTLNVGGKRSKKK